VIFRVGLLTVGTVLLLAARQVSRMVGMGRNKRCDDLVTLVQTGGTLGGRNRQDGWAT
jgi:hypothetical protein